MSLSIPKSRSQLLILALALLYFVQLVTSAQTIKYTGGRKNTSVTLAKNPNWKFSTDKDSLRRAHEHGTFNRTRHAPLKLPLNKKNQTSKHSRDFRPKERAIGSQPELAYGYYVFPFGIGTPEKTFSLIFDTGSSDLWTWCSGFFGMRLLYPDTGYDEYVSFEGHNYYTPEESSTHASLPPPGAFEVSYGGTTYSGSVGLDTTYIDTLIITETVLPCIEVEYGVPWLFQEYPGVDGILGLGLGQLNGEWFDPHQTFSAYLFPQLWYLPGFTTCFIEGVSATVDLAWIDDTKYVGDLIYTPASPGTDLWTFIWSGYQITGGTFTSTPVSVVITTGNSYMLLPPSVVAQWQNSIPNSHFDSWGLFYFPCTATLPDITFGVGDARFTLPGYLFNFGESGTSDCVTYCLGGLFSSGLEDKAYVGMPFYHLFFVVHNVKDLRIGIAKLNKDWV